MPTYLSLWSISEGSPAEIKKNQLINNCFLQYSQTHDSHLETWNLAG